MRNAEKLKSIFLQWINSCARVKSRAYCLKTLMIILFFCWKSQPDSKTWFGCGWIKSKFKLEFKLNTNDKWNVKFRIWILNKLYIDTNDKVVYNARNFRNKWKYPEIYYHFIFSQLEYQKSCKKLLERLLDWKIFKIRISYNYQLISTLSSFTQCQVYKLMPKIAV